MEEGAAGAPGADDVEQDGQDEAAASEHSPAREPVQEPAAQQQEKEHETQQQDEQQQQGRAHREPGC